MTVQAEATPVPDVDLDAAEKAFTELYRANWQRVQRYIWKRLDLSQGPLAEDLAQRAFLALWEDFYAKGKPVEFPMALVYKIARLSIGNYLNKKKNHETVLDITDPFNAPIIATGHAYAPETPHLAAISHALDNAMERMETASYAWRQADKTLHRLRSMLDNETVANPGGLTERTRERKRQDHQAAVRQESIRLAEFRAACAEVGRLRAELESDGGANWKSSSGMPASAGTRPRLKGSRSDPTATHCCHGHALTRENTYFHADGDRECRICKAKPQSKPKSPARAEGRRASSDTVPDDVLERARQMLADPANVRLRVVDIAKQCGMAQSTLNLRLGSDVKRLRQAAREAARTAGAAR